MLLLNVIILVIFNIYCPVQLYSQQLKERNDIFDLKNFKEEVFVKTDRDVYISGEQVWVKVYTINGLTHAPTDISKVVYLEMLDNNNFPLKQIKVRMDNTSGSASFILPENISSGNYLMRAYTSWMQNFSTDQFFYKSISVINPFEKIDNLKLSSVTRDTGKKEILSQTFPADDNRNQSDRSSVPKENERQIKYTINLGKTEYSSREKVKIVLSATDMAGNPLETDLSLSVAKSVLDNIPGMTGFYGFNRKDSIIDRVTGSVHLAELEGHIISGYMRLKATDEPLKNTDISLSFVGKTARCQFSKTDENGEFYFVIKESGLNEIVIQPLSPDISGYYVELNQPFISTFSNFKPFAFYLDSSKIDDINNAVISMQVNNIYEPFRQKIPEESTAIIPDFFGKAENTIKMSDYIELTSLREVVKEIMPNVYTQKQSGKYKFKLINKFRGHPFENQPLVLVDGVPIYDFEKVLNINSKDIERADIINTRYFIADNSFDGIVSFITKKGDLSAMDFDNSIFRQVYEGCQSPGRFYSPDYSTAQMRGTHIPDFRNTLFWKPDIHTGKDGKAEIEFYTSDESSKYTIVVEGISSDGERGFSTASLVVK